MTRQRRKLLGVVVHFAPMIGRFTGEELFGTAEPSLGRGRRLQAIKSIAVVVLGAFSVFQAGCVKKSLSREQASSSIQQSGEFQKPVYATVDQDGGLSGCSGKLIGDRNWQVLQAIGWIEPKERLDYTLGFGGNPGVRCEAIITDEGRKHSGAWISDTQMYKVWRIPTATRQMIAVNGIADQGGTSALVEFQYRWELSDFGSKMFQQPSQQAGQAVFQRFDDGWRIQSFGLAGLSEPQLLPVAFETNPQRPQAPQVQSAEWYIEVTPVCVACSWEDWHKDTVQALTQSGFSSRVRDIEVAV